MQAKELIRRVTEMAAPICREAGVELWDVTFEKEVRDHLLTIFIDSPEGINIEQCETVSRAIDPMLDAPVFSSLPAYTLCVSSAGLERKLTRPDHYNWAIGKKVLAALYQQVDGSKEVVGELSSWDEEGFVIEGRRLAAEEVAMLRLYFEF